MTDRIRQLTALTLSGEMYVKPVPTQFDREDLFLPREKRESKQLCEFILNQEPKICEFQKMTGFFRFDGSVVGDAFTRIGHKATAELLKYFFVKPIDGMCTQEWQHATANYEKVLSKGIVGLIEEIDESLKVHDKESEIAFLLAIKDVANALIGWTEKCSKRAEEKAQETMNAEYKRNLLTLASALKRVPKNAPQSFYEAVLTIYVCFSADPDSLGTLDRFLNPFYEKDIKNGVITREEAGEYLQELFLMVQAFTAVTNGNFTRGGESHFCVGGYLENGEDGFTDLSKLIIEKLVELPTYIPQVSLRWTKKTKREDFRYVMDLERKDPHKRIAFVNDEPRIKGFMEICNIPFKTAIKYTMIGCNEPAFPGAVTGSNSKINFVYALEKLLHDKSDECIATSSFDEFFALVERDTKAVIDKCYDYDNKFNLERAKDINYVSSLFFNDCIENAKSLTQGGGNVVVVAPMVLGITNVIDALIVIKQFVFDEKKFTMESLINNLKSDWEDGEMLAYIEKKGKFFGNDFEYDEVGKRVYDMLYRHVLGKRNVFGYPFIVGDLIGYNLHHVLFGKALRATPDGRKAFSPVKFGRGQSGGHDRKGLTALLKSIALVDEHCIGCGSTVTNVSLEKSMIENDENFEKTVDLFETYFRLGGMHFQLTYASKEDMLDAKVNPDKHRNMRVRVSGFSDYFTKLHSELQDAVIERTSHS